MAPKRTQAGCWSLAEAKHLAWIRLAECFANVLFPLIPATNRHKVVFGSSFGLFSTCPSHIEPKMILVYAGVEQLQKVQSGFLRQSGKLRSGRASRAGYTSPIPPIPREAMIS